MLVFREICPKSDAVKAKNRKPPDARGARVKAMPAVGCSCIFDKRYFRSLPLHSNCGMTLKEGGGTAENELGADKNKSLKPQKPSAPKGLPIFALIG